MPAIKVGRSKFNLLPTSACAGWMIFSHCSVSLYSSNADFIVGVMAGGAAGAIINKRNRVVGGVVGGIIGAGVGYGVGRGMDKKDGRY